MLNYKGNRGLTKYLGVVTGKEFEEMYNEMAHAEGVLPIASTIIPIKDTVDDETTPLFHAWIFYEEHPKKEKVAFVVNL